MRPKTAGSITYSPMPTCSSSHIPIRKKFICVQNETNHQIPQQSLSQFLVQDLFKRNEPVTRSYKELFPTSFEQVKQTYSLTGFQRSQSKKQLRPCMKIDFHSVSKIKRSLHDISNITKMINQQIVKSKQTQQKLKKSKKTKQKPENRFHKYALRKMEQKQNKFSFFKTDISSFSYH